MQASKKAGRKRKKLAQRNLMLGLLPPQEREALEKSMRVMDESLVRIWRQIRLFRRLRVILEYEAPWRAQLGQVLGQAIVHQVERDVFSKESSTSTSLKPGHRSSHERPILDFGITIVKPTSDERSFYDIYTSENMVLNTDENAAIVSRGAGAAIDPTKALMDALQGFVQAICIARRVGHWHQVLSGCQKFHNTCKQLMGSRLLQTHFWKGALWRGYFTACACLIDMLESVKVVGELPTLEAMLSSKTFGIYEATVEAESSASFIITENAHVVAHWTDRYREEQTQSIDID
ncbi:hypothetical protein HDV05_002221, partial [Chytridiales sp. JEL 0842]